MPLSVFSVFATVNLLLLMLLCTRLTTLDKLLLLAVDVSAERFGWHLTALGEGCAKDEAMAIAMYKDGDMMQ